MIARYTPGILAVAGLLNAASLLYAQNTPLVIVTDSLPPASVGVAYNQQLVTSGGNCLGTGTSSYSLDSGALPGGLAVVSPPSTKQWSLQGTPAAAGNFTFAIHLFWKHTRTTPFDHDCVDEAVKTLTLTVQGTSIGPGPGPGTGPSALTADRPQIVTIWHTGTFPPAADKVRVTAPGGAAIVVSAQTATDSSGPWLNVTSQSSTTPADLSISYSIGGLAQGTYTGRVIVSAAGLPSLTIPVTLQVITDNVQLQSLPSALAFSMVLGGPNPPAASLAITVAGVNLDRIFQVTVSGGKWLTVTPTAALTPASLAVTVTAKDLAAGSYDGVVTLSVAGIPNSSVAVPVKFVIQAPTPQPTIAAGGVLNAAGGGNAVAPGTWVSIYGTSLSSTTRAWRDADFVNGKLPTSLDGVSVAINGKSAAIAFISPGQVNVLAADDSATGLVPVFVRNSLGSSVDSLVLQQTAAPAFFQFPGTKYVAGTHADGSYLAAGTVGTAAKAGETVVLFGTGFGATDPVSPATSPVPVPLALARPQDLRVRIGGGDAAIAYAGLVSPGVYQFNVVVPQVSAGDQLVVAELRGLLTQAGLLLTVQ